MAGGQDLPEAAEKAGYDIIGPRSVRPGSCALGATLEPQNSGALDLKISIRSRLKKPLLQSCFAELDPCLINLIVVRSFSITLTALRHERESGLSRLFTCLPTLINLGAL